MTAEAERVFTVDLRCGKPFVIADVGGQWSVAAFTSESFVAAFGYSIELRFMFCDPLLIMATCTTACLVAAKLHWLQFQVFKRIHTVKLVAIPA